MRAGLRTWIEIDTSAIKHNYATFRSLIPAISQLCAVVKSNAYGHGLVDFAKEVVALGVDWVAVDSITEGLRLREEGMTIPILILGYTLPERIADAVENNISLSISSLEALTSVVEYSKQSSTIPKIHLKVDTGMSRQGFLFNDLQKVIDVASECRKTVTIEGLFTHFASAKNPAFLKDTQDQINIFSQWDRALKAAGSSFLTHASATSGSLLYKEVNFDMVRIGIGMYGLWPSLEARAAVGQTVSLKPVLTWKTLIAEVKKVPKGTRVGYDFTETLSQDSTIAVCPIGYWHGYSRRLSSIGQVLVNGKRSKVIGRVSMDMITIDVSSGGGGGVAVGDEVVLIGKQGAEEVDAYELALLDDTSWYETLTRINPLIKKFYI